MAHIEQGLGSGRNREIKKAVFQHRVLSRDGLSERIFALLFSGLVYPQIWEDPEVDIEAMKLAPGHRLVTIASGGCNVLGYLSRQPARIDAVDLNTAHIALNRLKLAAMRHLPSQEAVLDFFARDGRAGNVAAYDRWIAPHLDTQTRRYWEKRTWLGRRRISAFGSNFYKTGLLGSFIATGHAAARLHGVDPARIMECRSLREQRRFFDEELAPLFDKPLIRFVTDQKASLFGLGIPPAQYDELAAADDAGRMAYVLKARLEKLACHFSLKDNYFAWQAFARRYPEAGEAALPLYLQAEHRATIRENLDNVALHHINFTTLLAAKPARSVDRYVLLDAQDWMSDSQLNALWTEITRTADDDARVIFRTAGEPSILPGRVSPSLLGQWRYDAEASARGLVNDRSAIYGGFHVYVRTRN